MKLLNRTRRTIAVLMILVIMFTSLNYRSARANTTSSTSTFQEDGFAVTFTLENQWKEGYNANISIHNTGSRIIENWSLRFDMKNEITNIWNGTIENLSNGTYIIKNAGWNADIAVGSTVNFGFTVKGSAVEIPKQYSIVTVDKDLGEKTYQVEYILDTDWGDGFTARILITNLDHKPIENWKMEFDYERNITEIWNAKIVEHTNNHYILENVGYNQNIEQGGTIHIGFNGNGGEQSDSPHNIKMNGVTIENEGEESPNKEKPSEEFVEVADGKINTEYLYNAIYPILITEGFSVDDIYLSDDYDKDGLTLEEEYLYDLNPFVTDTDEDGVSDYDEIKVYKTDPLVADTDGDGLCDGTEISIKLDPLKKDSDGDGEIDGKEKTTQVISNESFTSLKNAKVKPKIKITGKQDYRDKIKVTDVSYNQAYEDIPGLLENVYEFDASNDLIFSKCTLTFTIKKSLLQENKIEDLAIAYYDEVNNEIEFLTTTCNKEKGTISADIKQLGCYMTINRSNYTSQEVSTLSIKASTTKYSITLSNGQVIKLNADPSLNDDRVDTDGDGIPDVIELKSSYRKKIYTSNSSYYYQTVWSFYSNPVKKDTDGDGINDCDDLSPTIYDIRVTADTESTIQFNTGRKWYKITCSSYDYLDNISVMIDNHVEHPIGKSKLKSIIKCVNDNSKVNFNYNELCYISVLNNEGAKLYLDSKSETLREQIFHTITNRESRYYKHTGILWWSKWTEVDSPKSGGFFKGKVISEYNLNLSNRLYYISDVFDTIDFIIKAGALVIASTIAIEAGATISLHIEALYGYCKSYGIIKGFQMYQYLGTSNLDDGLISWIEADMNDGDSCLDDIIDKNIPIYQRGETGEEALKSLYGGKSQVYFKTFVDGKEGGHYVDQLANNIAHEAKVGYTCLSKRVKIQILKDAYLKENGFVDDVVWEFFKSDATGRIGATKALKDFLTSNGIKYIIHE